MQENKIPSIRFRLPFSFVKTLVAGFAILLIYCVVLVLCFVFQHEIENGLGINPAKISIVLLMVVLFLPFGLLGWFLMKKSSRYATLNLSERTLIIKSLPEGKIIKNYLANEIDFVKLQGVAFHITFKDAYRFNVVNIGMGKGYVEELTLFMPRFRNFLQQNGVSVKKGNIL